jgi:transmembrane sensor
LGPESAIAIDYAPGRRRVELLKGMAYFEVAKDASRPFSVETRGLVVEAVGTAFDVSDDAGCTSVCVAQGSVETRARRKSETRAVSVAAGQWLSFDAGTGSVERGVRDLDQVASWRDGLLVADREPISALVARIGRWYPGRIVVLDHSIGAQRVSGLFDLNDPGAALEAIVHPAGARVRHISSYVAVISPI